MLFKVSGTIPVSCSIVVEAEDAEAALEVARKHWPKLKVLSREPEGRISVAEDSGV